MFPSAAILLSIKSKVITSFFEWETDVKNLFRHWAIEWSRFLGAGLDDYSIKIRFFIDIKPSIVINVKEKIYLHPYCFYYNLMWIIISSEEYIVRFFASNILVSKEAAIFSFWKRMYDMWVYTFEKKILMLLIWKKSYSSRD